MMMNVEKLCKRDKVYLLFRCIRLLIHIWLQYLVYHHFVGLDAIIENNEPNKLYIIIPKSSHFQIKHIKTDWAVFDPMTICQRHVQVFFIILLVLYCPGSFVSRLECIQWRRNEFESGEAPVRSESGGGGTAISTYSRCPRAQSFVKVGTRALRAPWSRRH